MKKSFEDNWAEQRRELLESFYEVFDKSRAMGWLEGYARRIDEGRSGEGHTSGRIREIGSGTFFTCLMEPAAKSADRLPVIVKFAAVMQEPVSRSADRASGAAALPRTWLPAMQLLSKFVRRERETGELLHGVPPFEAWQAEGRYIVVMPYLEDSLPPFHPHQNEQPAMTELSRLLEQTNNRLARAGLTLGEDYLQWRSWRGLPLLIDLSEVDLL